MASLATRNAVAVTGGGENTIVFAHGFGCDQSVWRQLVPYFEASHKIVCFDHVGSGMSDVSAYTKERYAKLDSYANDALEIAEAYGAGAVTLVGHSVGATIAMLAAAKAPKHIANLVMIAPSPCYLNDGAYRGGFSRNDIDQLLDYLESNYIGWSAAYAPVIMGNPERPELAAELGQSFCRMDPEIAKDFARATFLSDCRDVLPNVRVRSLALQCSNDAIAPAFVGDYVARTMPDCRLAILRATGHCPHQSAPDEVAAHIRAFLARS
ncbi:MAG: alpha/beta hydrolase [Magnetospirillum sp.]|jgi:sigma-B regulation protein RsbQ|nr:alpha/beta hydrolase [Magnetospirillum sp.]